MNTIISKIKTTLLILVIGIISGVYTESTAQIFNHITPRDGLTGGFINSIIKDSNGFLWFGTSTGLDRYNGYEFVNYRADIEDSTSISSSTILEVFEYDKTTFLVATIFGIDVLNPLTGKAFSLDLSDSAASTTHVYDFILQDEHTLWAGVNDGLFKIDPTTLNDETPEIQFIKNPAYNPNIGLGQGDMQLVGDMIWIGNSFGVSQFDTNTETFNSSINVNQKASKITRSAVWKIYETSTGDIYVAADSGLAVLRNGENVIDAVTELGDWKEDQMMQIGFQTIAEDEDGNLWIGSALDGAIRQNLSTDEITHFRANTETESSIQSDDVHFIFAGIQNEIWFGYHNLGLSLMFDRSWNYTIEQPFPELEVGNLDNAINWVEVDESGNTWLAIFSGLIKIDPNADEPELFRFEDEQFNFQSLTSSEDDIYGFAFNTSTNVNSLFRFDVETEEYEIFENPLGVQPVPFIKFNIDNTMVFAANGNQLTGFDFTSNEYFQKNIPQLSENTADVAQQFTIPIKDADDNMFVIYLQIGQNGVTWQNFIYDTATEEFIASPALAPPGNPGFGPPLVSRTEPGVVYARLLNGFYRQNLLTGETSYLFESESSILGESNGFFIEDDDGYIWTTNSTGIMRLDPVTESISYYELEEDRFNNYAIQSQQENGDIVFPGSGGILRFNPDQLQEEDPISSIHINNLQTGNEQINTLYGVEDELEVDFSNNNISFLYTGINYKEPSFTNYRYKLIGYSDEWNEVGTQRSVFIPNLPPADYTFQVQAASRFGGFTGPVAELNFTVLPPLWRTIPAYIFYFLVLIGAIISVDRFQRRRLLRLAREKSREKELEQAREIEKAYNNLQAAQEQLVQQEKLASLGQLTAGIAHEIKNPLNFVNNFSDLSVELLEEAREELQKTPADAEEALEILKDIEANLKKIHEHGARADSIVKSMLQHSRGGTGELEPTDLNALVSEFVNLSFHGMRAGKNPINVDIDVQLDESIETVPLIGEDFSRVVINLCNNAFDAMRTKTGNEGYKPKLTVRTEKTKNWVLLSVEDNGPGIPEHYKDKILQPFFTTKKGTEGTGLGLSITNDIIKAHRGTLEIESKDNEFTRFNIYLTQTGA